MKIVFQILQTHHKQRIPSIILTFESKKYFFNTPETLQRYLREHNVKFTKGSQIFLTQTSTDHITGLFGFLLTLYEQKMAFGARLYGPTGISNYINNIRFLFGFRILAYSVYDIAGNGSKLLGVKSLQSMEKIIGHQNYSKMFNKMNEHLEAEQKKNPDDINDAADSIIDGQYYKDELIEIYPVIVRPDNEAQHKVAISYICKPNKLPGKIDKLKLKELNVPTRFINKIVEAGELEIEGKLYRAKDFQEDDGPSPVIIIIDCPDTRYASNLITNEKIHEYFEAKINEKEVDLKAIIHLCPKEVLLSADYIAFTGKFPKACNHIFINDSFKDDTFSMPKNEDPVEEKKDDGTIEEETVYRNFLLTNVYNRYFPNHFPKLGEIDVDGIYDIKKVYPHLQNAFVNPKLSEYILAPVKSQGFKEVKLSFEKMSKLTNFSENAQFKKKYDKLMALEKAEAVSMKEEAEILKKFQKCDPEMVFLGTGSMMPSLFRNVSCVYLRFWQQGDIGMMLDCGEGSYFQLLHHYGKEKTREFLKNLKVIFITHVHADHHLGLLQVLHERDLILKEDKIELEPVYLIIPYNCSAWIKKYSKEVQKLNYKLIFNQHLNINSDKAFTPKAKFVKLNDGQDQSGEKSGHKHSKKSDGDDEFEYIEDPDVEKFLTEESKESLRNIPEFEKFLAKGLGITGFKTVSVKHCPQAFALLIEHEHGWRYVYSGDTRPCQKMVDEIGEVTILVHEATFSHALQETANHKMHSTDREAIEIGVKMQAWRTVLTHFSQRYSKTMIPGNENMKKDLYYNYYKRNTVVACDHLRFKFSELEKLPPITRCLNALFPENF